MKLSETISALHPFIGTWFIEGTNLSSSPHSPDTPVTGVWEVKIMEGGKFLESHWEYDFGSNKHIGISMLGIPTDDSQLKIFSFDNGGFYRAYDLNIKDQVWNITGDTERAKMQFDIHWKSYKEFWEIKKDGKWHPLCERVGTKR